MSCFTKEQIVRYINDQLKEEERQRFEDHLYDCDHCLSIYSEALDEWTSVLLQSESFTDDVMARIKGKEQREGKTSRYQPLIHYTIAAGFTLMLMFTGVFEQLTTFVSDDMLQAEQPGAISNKMMDRTIEVIEKFNAYEKEGHYDGK